MVQGNPVKSYIRAPEGKYDQHSERTYSSSYSAHRPTRLTFATLENPQKEGSPLRYIIFNASDALNISQYAMIDKSPDRQIVVGGTAHSVYPTCHAFASNVQGYDLIVGLSTGDIVLGSLQAQLSAPRSNHKLLDMLHFNKSGSVDPTRAVDVMFMPGSHGGYFISAHESGNVHMYCTSAGVQANGSPKVKGATPQSLIKTTKTIKVSDKELKSSSVSPDGTKIASTTKDGVLYVHNLATGDLIGGFKSFCGGLLCCAWSFDSRYIAAGGEDDLITVYGLEEQKQVLWGEGHSSWVTRIAFDRWESKTGSGDVDQHTMGSRSQGFAGPEITRYRIVSTGQDCQVLFWDFIVEDGDYLEPEGTGQRMPSLNEAPSGVHKRIPSSTAVNAMNGSNSSGASGLGSHGLPTLIHPASKQAEMILSTPVASQLIHHDPCSDILLIREAMYTASYCCEVKCWLRPAPPPSQQSEQPDNNEGSRQNTESRV